MVIVSLVGVGEVGECAEMVSLMPGKSVMMGICGAVTVVRLIVNMRVVGTAGEEAEAVVVETVDV